MSLYQCEECGCCENTATGCYWGQERKLCSACGPAHLRGGVWHNRFERVFLPVGMFETNDQGNLAHKETGDIDFYKHAIK